MSQDSQRPADRFVIHLCSLPTPITIPQPRASQLTRFSFFLSHSWEGDRRQYRLLMGYFATVAEANKWLATLIRVYPMAFVTTAPEAQPDLMSNTQALRILQIGQVEGVAQGSERRSEFNSRTGAQLPSTTTVANGAAPARKSYASGGSLDDTLEELRTSEFDMGDDTDPNSTGVRHLRIEVQRDKALNSARKEPAARNRK